MNTPVDAAVDPGSLNSACRKAYLRLLPLLFVCYVIAYIDRVNVGFAKLRMMDALEFSESVFGLGMGIFFIGYLLLEIPGTLLVEKWSAKKWISRIMISWGFLAAATAWVSTPWQFYVVRFLLGVAEAGFFPGIIVYLTHWFPKSDRTKALAWFFIGTPIAQIIAPPISAEIMDIGTYFQASGQTISFTADGSHVPDKSHITIQDNRDQETTLEFVRDANTTPSRPDNVLVAYSEQDTATKLAARLADAVNAQESLAVKATVLEQPPGKIQFESRSTAAEEEGQLKRIHGSSARVGGLLGWQWVYVFWGIPAVALGVIVLLFLTDRPHQAHWLTDEERRALEGVLRHEKEWLEQATGGHGRPHMSIGQALANPKVLGLAAAYFFVVTGNYGVELYMASILEDWYKLVIKDVAILVVIPPIGSVIGQLVVGWSSDRTGERRWHAALPIVLGAAALATVPFSEGNKFLTVALFTVAMTGLKAYLPAFWSLPNLFLTAAAAAASIGMINSFGNLGGWVGPTMIGMIKEHTGEYRYGLWFLGLSMVISACIIFSMRFEAKKS